MQAGQKLAEGKTKIISLHPDDPTLVIMEHKDGITAGDGARRHVIPGKGVLSGRTTANVFALLNAVSYTHLDVYKRQPSHPVTQSPGHLFIRSKACGDAISCGDAIFCVSVAKNRHAQGASCLLYTSRCV